MMLAHDPSFSQLAPSKQTGYNERKVEGAPATSVRAPHALPYPSEFGTQLGGTYDPHQDMQVAEPFREGAFLDKYAYNDVTCTRPGRKSRVQT